MAKNNNLTDFLTGVANAIRAKKGTSDLINPQDFENEIASISGGVSLNIEYSDIPPTDTSKLWVKAATPSSVKIDSEILGSEILQTDVSVLETNTGGSAAAAVGSKIYLLGKTGQKINRVFDTTTNTMNTLSANFSQNTSDMAAAAVGSKIYLFGGLGGGNRLNTINVFDTTTNTISTLSATLPTAANKIAAAAVGNKIYLFGGIIDNYSNGQNTINVFDTLTNTLSTSSARLPLSAHSIAVAAVGSKIYLFGGFNSSDGYLSTINVFDTTTDTISTLSATLPTAASNILASTVGTKIYLIGGYGNNYLLTINAFIVQSPLNNGNIQIVFDTSTNLFDIVTDEALQMRIGVKQVYKGNVDNGAELCDAYLYDGTNWVNVNTGEIYSM